MPIIMVWIRYFDVYVRHVWASRRFAADGQHGGQPPAPGTIRRKTFGFQTNLGPVASKSTRKHKSLF